MTPAQVTQALSKVGRSVSNAARGQGAFGPTRPARERLSIIRTPKRSTPPRITPTAGVSSYFNSYENMASGTGSTAQHMRKQRKQRERFVDAQGNWQSFMYYRVGNEGDPRPTDMKSGMGSTTGPIKTGSVPSVGPKQERLASLGDFLSDTQAGISQAWGGISAPFR